MFQWTSEQQKIIPTYLLGKIHDLSKYLGHTKSVIATIDIKIDHSHYYFSVDRSHETQAWSPSQGAHLDRNDKKKTPSNYQRNQQRNENFNNQRNFIKTSLVLSPILWMMNLMIWIVQQSVILHFPVKMIIMKKFSMTILKMF